MASMAQIPWQAYVILVSVDGLSPSPWSITLAEFQRVIRRGARARGMIPVFPTCLSESLLTRNGTSSRRHGIVFNRLLGSSAR